MILYPSFIPIPAVPLGLYAQFEFLVLLGVAAWCVAFAFGLGLKTALRLYSLWVVRRRRKTAGVVLDFGDLDRYYTSEERSRE